MRLAAAALSSLLLAGSASAAPPPPPARSKPPGWLGEELPLPLAVRTPEDLQFKTSAERQYLLFNLLAGGKLAWDVGDFAGAASKWEALLRLPGLPADLDASVRPFALEARRKAGGSVEDLPPAPLASERPAAAVVPASAVAAADPRKASVVNVIGTVTGGGSLGPGGTVVFLKRADGPTPKPRPVKGKSILQKGKSFVPRVLAIPVGSTVEFRNEDEISHNVFSLTAPNDFDLGLYKPGLLKTQDFNSAGPVQLLCNIHSSMIGYVYAVESPWFAQADGSGAFTIKGVPPGDYVLEAWHEGSSRSWSKVVRVEEGATFTVPVSGDRKKQAFVPDKYGKPRQEQLGY